jgi:phosphotransferase system HPr (HPr) family protein
VAARPRALQSGFQVMDEPKATRTVLVANRAGLHARAALLVVQLVRQFREHHQVKVELVSDRQRVDASVMMQLLTLGAAQGEQLLVEAVGDGAEEIVEALDRLFKDKFYEDQPEVK